VLQERAPMRDFAGNIPVVGSWIVGETACGLGIREDRSPITGDASRFVPHFIA
jgi:glutathionylspermidine synthase